MDIGSELSQRREGAVAELNNNKVGAQIVYFDKEGRDNLEQVLRVIKNILKKRTELRSHKVVVFTAEGQGAALAYNKLMVEFGSKIIAVTFPVTFSVKASDDQRFYPKISDSLQRFFSGVGIDVVVPPTLPFDLIEGMDGHNQQMKLVNQTIAIFGGGFGLCIQAVLRACDVGLVKEGEPVIAMSGDTAGLFIASTTGHFLNGGNGMAIQEIFCKPRNLTVSRPNSNRMSAPSDAKLIEGEVQKS